MLPRVLFVSKPIAPPFHDGSKCLVRDLATHLKAVHPIVLTTRDAPWLGEGIEHERIYPNAGTFAPAIRDNARVFRRLLWGTSPDLWHFVFAPNPVSSHAAKLARLMKGIPTVQTIASAPRSFDGVSRLLFGDRVVALSEHTKGRLIAAGADAKKMAVIPPTVPRIPTLSAKKVELARARIGIDDDRPLVIYPGDLEVSKGAKLVAEAASAILARTDATICFACRKKTPRAEDAEASLRALLAQHGERVRFVGEVKSLPELLAGASVVLFPVDDLYGKVDLPIAVLETMDLGVPVVALDEGPLAELRGVVHVSKSSDELAAECIGLLLDSARRADIAAEAKEIVEARHRPSIAAAAYEEIYEGLLKGLR